MRGSYPENQYPYGFQSNRETYENRHFNETETRIQFLNPLLNASAALSSGTCCDPPPLTTSASEPPSTLLTTLGGFSDLNRIAVRAVLALQYIPCD